MFVLLWVWTS